MDDMPASGTRKRQSFSCLRVFLAVFAIVGAMAVILVILILPDLCPSLGKIEKTCSLKFPPSANLVKSYGRIFLEHHILAKVEMDRADVDQFVNFLPEPREMSETDKLRIELTRYAMDWWDPHSARRFTAIRFEREESYGDYAHWKILIDLDDPDKAIVYLDYWEP